MRAGRLTSTLIITRRTETIEADGKASDTWAPVLTTRAEIISSDARAFLAEAGEQTERAVVFRVRYRDGIEPGDRVTLGGQAFQLVETKEVVRRRVLELRCVSSRL